MESNDLHFKHLFYAHSNDLIRVRLRPLALPTKNLLVKLHFVNIIEDTLIESLKLLQLANCYQV